MRSLLVALTFLSIALTSGCAAKKTVAVHPGAVSNLDSYSYDVLLVESAVLELASTDLKAGKLPETAKSFLNTAIKQFNVTQAAWHAYHDQHAGNDTVLQDAINALVGAVGQLEQVLGKAPKPISQRPSQRVPRHLQEVAA